MQTIVRLSLAALALASAGCSSPDPLIDRMGVSDAKYNRDIAECRDQGSGWFSFGGGTSLSDCMKGKGYKVLMGNSGL